MTNEGVMTAALRKRHPDDKGEWAFLSQVGNRPNGARRYADVIAVNLWESRGWAIHGYEIKCSRSDWLTELRDSEKADLFWRHCDYWTIAVPAVVLTGGSAGKADAWGGQNIVREDELPDGWGLAVWQGERWRNVVKATKNAARERPPFPMMMAMLRRAVGGSISEAERAAAREDGHRRGLEEGERRGRSERARIERDYDRIQESVKVLEEATGFKIGDFSCTFSYARQGYRTPQEYAEAWRAFMAADDTLDQVKRRAAMTSQDLRRLADELEGLTT